MILTTLAIAAGLQCSTPTDITYNGLSCPAAVGDVNLEMEVNVKPYAPSGMYTAHISAKDQDGENLLCVKVTFAL